MTDVNKIKNKTWRKSIFPKLEKLLTRVCFIIHIATIGATAPAQADIMPMNKLPLQEFIKTTPLTKQAAITPGNTR